MKESVTEYKADCDSLPDRLQLVLKNLGVPEAEFVKCDRVRTAKAVKTLLAACEGKEPTPLVGAIAKAKTRDQRHVDGEEPEVGEVGLWNAFGPLDGICSRLSPNYKTNERPRPIC